MYFFLKKLKHSNLAGLQDTPARNNRTGLQAFYDCFLEAGPAIIKSNGWGHSHCATRI